MSTPYALNLTDSGFLLKFLPSNKRRMVQNHSDEEHFLLLRFTKYRRNLLGSRVHYILGCLTAWASEQLRIGVPPRKDLFEKVLFISSSTVSSPTYLLIKASMQSPLPKTHTHTKLLMRRHSSANKTSIGTNGQ